MSGSARTILIATAVAGTLDIVSAFIFAGIAGTGPIRVLQSVASGPLGGRAASAPGYAIFGLVVHYAIMAAMVAAFVTAGARRDLLVRRPLVSGALYGLLLWLVMYWLVLPLRFGIGVPHRPIAIAQQLFSHIVCVGLPMALIAARGRTRR